MAKKCFKAALYIFVLLIMCFCTLCVFADSKEQNTSVCAETVGQPQTSAFADDVTITQPEPNSPHGHVFEVKQPSFEHLSDSRCITVRDTYNDEPQYAYRTDGVSSILCSELNKINFQVILKQNE